MIKDTTFSDIINRKISSKIIYQDDLVTAFNDIKPKAPIHILIVSNTIIRTINDINSTHELLLSRLFFVAVRLAKKLKIDKKGYRLIINCNTHGEQEIYHLHMHLLGGKKLGPLIITT